MKNKIFSILFVLNIVSISIYAMQPQERYQYRIVNKADAAEEISANLIPFQGFFRGGTGILPYYTYVDPDFNLRIKTIEVHYLNPEQGGEWSMVFNLSIPKDTSGLIKISIFNNFCRIKFENGTIKDIPGNLRRIKSSLTQESSAT